MCRRSVTGDLSVASSARATEQTTVYTNRLYNLCRFARTIELTAAKATKGEGGA